jgi:hypothetical protein
MIEFACRCKHRFSVADNLAGDVIQCPACGRLNDIPTLDDLPHLDKDGAFDVYQERPKDDQSRLAELGIIYAKGSRDAEGDEIDLRLPAGDADPIPLAGEGPAGGIASSKERPKYDPETGERILPLDVKADPVSPAGQTAIPLAQTVIHYATPDADFRRFNPAGILLQLFAPGNVIVMAFVFLAHLLLIVSTIIVLTGFWLIVVVPFIVGGMILAHYGNVVDETGPQEQDELPRPLRSVSWGEDLWGPFVHVSGSFILCALPLFIVLRLPMPGIFKFIGAWAAAAGGLLFLPAVLLTMLTSGTVLNVRPDRLIGVIRAAGPNYAVAVVAVILAITFSLLGYLGVEMSILSAANPALSGNPLAKWFIAIPTLLTGIYLSHAAGWFLGKMYRAHHDQFPWILQRHISTRKTSLDPATDFAGRAQRPRQSTGEKLKAIRESSR